MTALGGLVVVGALVVAVYGVLKRAFWDDTERSIAGFNESLARLAVTSLSPSKDFKNGGEETAESSRVGAMPKPATTAARPRHLASRSRRASQMAERRRLVVLCLLFGLVLSGILSAAPQLGALIFLTLAFGLLLVAYVAAAALVTSTQYARAGKHLRGQERRYAATAGGSSTLTPEPVRMAR